MTIGVSARSRCAGKRGGTAATELRILGTNATGSTLNGAYAINAAGTTVGYGMKYGADGSQLGMRAVRWDAGTTAATELGNLGVNPVGNGEAVASAINDAGTAIGYSLKQVGTTNLGYRAVRCGRRDPI